MNLPPYSNKRSSLVSVAKIADNRRWHGIDTSLTAADLLNNSCQRVSAAVVSGRKVVNAKNAGGRSGNLERQCDRIDLDRQR
jgi:hypothetical protein